jgi:regulator of cell morphogenesis and NO signaling
MKTAELHDTTVAELVASDYRTAEIFKRHGIDFCCGGKKSIEKVCAEKNLDASKLQEEILALQNAPKDNEYNFNEWELSFLIDYIVNVHHVYVNRNMNQISEYAQKVARVHGDHNTETKDIVKLWDDVVAELTMHMKKEELVLFPYIKNIERYSKGGLKEFPLSHFGTVRNPIRMMEQEHDLAGSLMKHIATLSSNFTPPAHACNTYRVLYAKLKEFQDDLHQHIHLENNILFPKVADMEDTFAAVKNSCAL